MMQATNQFIEPGHERLDFRLRGRIGNGERERSKPVHTLPSQEGTRLACGIGWMDGQRIPAHKHCAEVEVIYV